MVHSGIRLIVGLANPGKQYTLTRHNVGAWFLHQLAQQNAASFSLHTQFHGLVAQLSAPLAGTYLLEPTTFMNESGSAVRSFMQFYKISCDQVLVVHDELDFEPGVVRLKKGGGHGGHNGLRDIIAKLGTPEFYRLRIGIGHPGDRHQVISYVLGQPSQSDKERILSAIDQCTQMIDEFINGDFEKVMRQLHA